MRPLLLGFSMALLWVLGARAQPALTWSALPEAFAEAGDTPVLVYVASASCGPCRKMERDVFPATAPLLGRLVRAKLDFDDHVTALRFGAQSRTPFEWARHLGVTATPGFVLLSPEGGVLVFHTGFLTSDTFGLLLAYAATGAYRHATFAQYVAQVDR